MEISPLSSSNIFPKEGESPGPQHSETVIIDQSLVVEEVGMLATISNSFHEIFTQTKNYIDRNIDARAVTNNADKIVESLARERDRFMPKEREWNEKIETFVTKYQNEKSNREQIVATFLREVEDSYNLEIKVLDGLQNIAEKSLAFENFTMQFTAIGQKIAKTVQLLDTGSLDLIEKVLNSSDLAVPWIKVGLLSHKISLYAKKIEFCEREISNAVALSESGALSLLERKECEAKIDMLHNQIINFKAEQAQITDEIVEEGVKGSLALLDKTHQILSESTASTLIREGAKMLVDVSVAAEGAVLAGSVISLGLKVYQVAQSSDRLITLKRNMETLKNEHRLETIPIKAVILKAKLDRLRVLERDISIALAKNILEGVVGSMAICASVQSLLLAAGVIMTATTTLCLNATGVGAAILGTGLTVGGLAYATYTHRHEIKHTVATADIPVRRLFLGYQLHKEMQIYEKAEEIFEESGRSLQSLQLMLPAAWETKKAIDARRGSEALEQQKQITRVYLNLHQELEETVDRASTASLTMSVALPRLKQLRRELQVLEKRQEIEDLQLVWKKLEGRFSTYDIKTLMAVDSMINSAVESPDDTDRTEIKKLMLSHNYLCRIPITSEQVFDFIMEDKLVISQSI